MREDNDWCNPREAHLLLAIPTRMQAALARYMWHGEVPGSFLEAVLRNDLTRAVGSADNENIHLLRDYSMILCNCLPGRPNVWGSQQAIMEWNSIGGLAAIQASTHDDPVKVDLKDRGRNEAMWSLIQGLGGQATIMSDMF